MAVLALTRPHSGLWCLWAERLKSSQALCNSVSATLLVRRFTVPMARSGWALECSCYHTSALKLPTKVIRELIPLPLAYTWSCGPSWQYCSSLPHYGLTLRSLLSFSSWSLPISSWAWPTLLLRSMPLQARIWIKRVGLLQLSVRCVLFMLAHLAWCCLKLPGCVSRWVRSQGSSCNGVSLGSVG